MPNFKNHGIPEILLVVCDWILVLWYSVENVEERVTLNPIIQSSTYIITLNPIKALKRSGDASFILLVPL